MQLILEADNTSIDINEKMSVLDQESLSDKLITNGVKDPVDVPNGNKENIQTKDNIIINEEKLILIDDKQTMQEDAPVEPKSSVDIFKADVEETSQNIVELPESIDENTESITKEDIRTDNNITNTTVAIESLNDIIHETRVKTEDEDSSCPVFNEENNQEDCASAEVKSEITSENKNIDPENISSDIELDAVSENIDVEEKQAEVVDIERKQDQSVNVKIEETASIDNEVLSEDNSIEVDPDVAENDIKLELEHDKNTTENSPVSNMDFNLSGNNLIEKNENGVQDEDSLKNKICQIKDDTQSQIDTNNINTDNSEVISKTEESTAMTLDCDDKIKTDLEHHKSPDSSMECDEMIPCKDTSVSESLMECDSVSNVVLTDNDTEAVDSMDCDIITPVISDTTKEFVENAKNVDTTPKDDEIQTDVDSVTEIDGVSKSMTIGSNTIEKPEQTIVSSKSENVSTLPAKIIDVTDVTTNEESKATNSKDEVVILDDIKVIEDDKNKPAKNTEPTVQQNFAKVTPNICRLSNTLDILSDDEDEPPKLEESQDNKITNSADKQCIDIEDDDDIMLIDEDKNKKDETKQPASEGKVGDEEPKSDSNTLKLDVSKDSDSSRDTNAVTEQAPVSIENDSENKEIEKTEVTEKREDHGTKLEKLKPLIPDNFLKSYKKNLADMTRDDLEELCILKIVESVIDRSSLNEIRSKLKTMTQNIDEYKKKAMLLTKQNRDLQVVLKSVQEEQKKGGGTPITPLKITRSVGMQVLMTEKVTRRKGVPSPANTANSVNNTRPVRNVNQSPRQQSANNNQQIPVPRLVPASNINANKTNNTTPQMNTKNAGKTASPMQNGVVNSPPVPKSAEKRPFSRMQSITVDLTDDEPPNKVTNKVSPAPPVRLVPSQNLMAPRPQMGQHTTPQGVNSPRKVYIPISGPPNQTIRAAPTIMLKSGPLSTPRPRTMGPMVRIPQNTVRMPRTTNNRHPAPLPGVTKQYQPPNWKALPPAPDLKLSKVENGIVISWKIDGYQEDSYEEIASYQLYAYQETSAPPSTNLWKKIGDVKALPLPMACTLTQFMAGFKYYFAVRAVDVRSRLGPFSLPGSILLLNKM